MLWILLRPITLELGLNRSIVASRVGLVIQIGFANRSNRKHEDVWAPYHVERVHVKPEPERPARWTSWWGSERSGPGTEAAGQKP